MAMLIIPSWKSEKPINHTARAFLTQRLGQWLGLAVKNKTEKTATILVEGEEKPRRNRWSREEGKGDGAPLINHKIPSPSSSSI